VRAKYFIPVPGSLSLWGLKLPEKLVENNPRMVHGDSWKPEPATYPHCKGPAHVEHFKRQRTGGPTESVSQIRCDSNKPRGGQVEQLGCPVVVLSK